MERRLFQNGHRTLYLQKYASIAHLHQLLGDYRRKGFGMGRVTLGVERFNLNVARAFVGHHVNLHMRDGSVLVNVCVTDIKREKETGKPAVFCISQHGKHRSRVFLKEIQWMEQLNPFIFA